MSEPTPRVHAWTRAEYEHIVDVGGFAPEARLELLDGEIIDMSPQKSAHAAAVGLVTGALQRCLGDGMHLRSQMPLALDDHSEPEPDVAVVPGSIRDYSDHHPSTAALIVEVADSSLAFDRLRKTAAYARNGIPEYWILNLKERVLEVRRDPVGEAYQQHVVLQAGDNVSPLCTPGDQVSVASMLP